MIDRDRIYPKGKYILVERDEVKVAKGAILLPNAETYVSNRGYVVATNYDSEVCDGDRIIWAQYAGHGIDKEEPRLIFIKEEDVIAVITEDDGNKSKFVDED